MHQRCSTLVTLAAGALAIGAADSRARAELCLAPLFTDNMVLQQDSRATIWGWADPNQDVQIIADWLDAPVTTTADNTGAFSAVLPTQAASREPRTVTIRAGDQEHTLSNVLIGEVWLCSGQSNMEWPVSASMNADDEIAAADHPTIRFFQVANAIAPAPRPNCEGDWQICTPETTPGFSAVAYFFGRELHDELDVPVGLIDATWGGTPAEAWTSAETLRPLGDFNPTLDRIAVGSIEEIHPTHPASLYNAMIAPLHPFAIRGTIWYQGESNVGRAEQYQRLFPAMIEDWRRRFNRADMPFYFVQIAPWRYPNDNGAAARLRESQLFTLNRVPHTGMVVTTDIGNVDDIHPRNKQEVGRRLSLWALAHEYGREKLTYSGPIFTRMSVEENAARIHFAHADTGLAANGSTLTHFRIAGPDRIFHDANAVIDGETVVVSSPKVTDPVAVRFGFDATAEPNLFNADGLPASPFRTDDWEDVP